MRNKAAIPQIDRVKITEKIFGTGGLTNADSSFCFDEGVKRYSKWQVNMKYLEFGIHMCARVVMVWTRDQGGKKNILK